MSAPGMPEDETGTVVIADSFEPLFKVPYGKAQGYGRPRDVGALALALLANWYIAGETVLIDGGARTL